ncbi:13549_t:CDS:2 [Cetraspora pellucida]|uniref:13549_t:CDS:1 n=1 Tax=Cetraspora pellucida TaxID=1433469 RepID=A0ACA9KB70_9GLOM|nr:13549_t:CDS:2 [Cetraspora pellucida]
MFTSLKQDKNTEGFASFSELYKYIDFVITLKGQQVSGVSLVLKHVTL